jgi:hypothetical protein
VRGKNHEKKIDTGTFFQNKNDQSNNKEASPASTAYAPAIHGKYMLPQPMPRLFMGNTCFHSLCPGYSWQIHAISLTINSEGYINSS